MRAAFGQAEVCPCDRHLQHAPESLMRGIQHRDPGHRAAIQALRPRVERALTGASFGHALACDALSGDGS